MTGGIVYIMPLIAMNDLDDFPLLFLRNAHGGKRLPRAAVGTDGCFVVGSGNCGRFAVGFSAKRTDSYLWN